SFLETIRRYSRYRIPFAPERIWAGSMENRPVEEAGLEVLGMVENWDFVGCHWSAVLGRPMPIPMQEHRSASTPTGGTLQRRRRQRTLTRPLSASTQGEG